MPIMHEFADQVRALADGPHTPEQTVEIARTVEEASRVLVYATRTNAGVGYTSTLYDVVGALERSAYGIGEVLRHTSDWLAEHETALTFDGCHPYDAMQDAFATVASADAAAVRLASVLGALHSRLGPIGGPVSHGGA